LWGGFGFCFNNFFLYFCFLYLYSWVLYVVDIIKSYKTKKKIKLKILV
jgi:hypothetical protein